MAIIRKTLDELRTTPRTIDRDKIAATTEEEIRQYMIEDGEIEVFVGSGNVFADLGFSDAEERLAKARVVSGMLQAARRKRLTDVQVGAAIGIGAQDVAGLWRGRFDAYSLEHLQAMAASLEWRAMTMRQIVKAATGRVAAIRCDVRDARRWMREPSSWLNGGVPIEMLKTEEGRVILDTYLRRVEYDGGQGC